VIKPHLPAVAGALLLSSFLLSGSGCGNKVVHHPGEEFLETVRREIVR